MRAAVFLGNGEHAVAERDIDELGPNQVLLELEGCGICASNIPAWQGRPWFRYPLTAGAPGHEPWGRVRELGEAVRGLMIGQRVTGLSYRAYAECDVANADELVVIPQELDGMPFPGEAFACAMNVVDRAGIEADQDVAVVGAGFIGSVVIQIATAAGARVAAYSARPWSLEQARAQGAVAARPIQEAAADAGRYARVVECTGVQQGLDAAADLVATGGRLVVAGYHQEGLRTVNMQQWNWKGIDVVNAHERAPARYVGGIRNALDAIRERRLDPWPLLSHRFGLHDIDRAFRLLAERPDGFTKAVLAP
ncbi:MAG: zinc-binding dehydrogenase [Gammaproteobacteria bacterium]|nr:zinc-binding dehydrogenase [Gammaproteobacteria bacterium]